MYLRSLCVGLLAALLVGACGCKKSPSTVSPEAPKPTVVAPTPPPIETVAHLHWLGKKRLSAETNAAELISIWNLPESIQLETQTIDKLTSAPWRLFGLAVPQFTNSPDPQGAAGSLSNRVSALHAEALRNPLRPLLEDLLQEESYLEIRNATNLPGELALAIRLDGQQAGRWETNLTSVFESLGATQIIGPTPGPSCWRLATASGSFGYVPQVCFRQAKDWTILSLMFVSNAVGSTASSALQPPSELTASFTSRIESAGTPCPQSSTNWLDAFLVPGRAACALGHAGSFCSDWPKIVLAVNGSVDNVRTCVGLDFPKPLPFELEPWTIPTNLIHEPIASFAAVQGIRPALMSCGRLSALDQAVLPNQMFFWSQGGAPFLNCLAAPVEGSNPWGAISDLLIKELNPWLATNGQSGLQRATNFDGLVWPGLSIVTPRLSHVRTGGGDFIMGDLIDQQWFTNRVMPLALIEQLVGRTNVVGYEWEMTGPHIEQWLYLAQLARFSSRMAQLPAKSVGVVWLRALELKLANCATVVTRTRVDQLQAVRKSTIGLSALELHLLVDWLESPQFPSGVYSLLGTTSPTPKKLSPATNTNSTPSGR